MNMYPEWSAVPKKRNLRLHLMNSQGQSAQYVDLTPSDSSDRGYCYKVPSNIGAMQGLYEGYAYYEIRKGNNPQSAISLRYAHDASSNRNTSYSLSLGYIGISITGNTSNIYSISDNFDVSGLN